MDEPRRANATKRYLRVEAELHRVAVHRQRHQSSTTRVPPPISTCVAIMVAKIPGGAGEVGHLTGKQDQACVARAVDEEQLFLAEVLR